MQHDKTEAIKVSDSKLIENWQTVLDKITSSIHNNEESKPVTLIAVSKTKPVAMIKTLLDAGQRDFAENYLQEALPKIQALNRYRDQQAIHWHYIGHIQRNKTRDISENFDWVHTIEREIIAKRLNNQRPDILPNLNVLIQVNIDNEPNKSGCLPDDVGDLVDNIKDYERLNLRGLMIIPEKQNTNAFARTKELFEQIDKQYPTLKQWDTLSMGMSDDMEAAIAQGATMVRVGSAIFGARETI